MSKVGLEIEIGISKSKFFIDGLYRDTLPLIFSGLKVTGNTILIPSVVWDTTGF